MDAIEKDAISREEMKPWINKWTRCVDQRRDGTRAHGHPEPFITKTDRRGIAFPGRPKRDSTPRPAALISAVSNGSPADGHDRVWGDDGCVRHWYRADMKGDDILRFDRLIFSRMVP
jgi:hypothetical protein